MEEAKERAAKLSVEEVLAGIADFNKNWDNFQRRFDQMNAALVQNIGVVMGRGSSFPALSPEEKKKVLGGDVSAKQIAKRFSTYKNIIVMCGAGISTSAGIPDFRSPGTGLYDNLQKYDLPTPQSIFNIDYFRDRPEPFCMLAKELFPGKYKPTLCHRFIKLLSDKGVLLRDYTQNIDGLEDIVGIPEDKLVQAHGHFKSAHCIECHVEVPVERVQVLLEKDEVPRCEAPGCGGLVKPDIVFFGESLPERYSLLKAEDFPKCDLLIVMGTALAVQPFASLVNEVPPTVPRLVINRELPECFLPSDSPDNYRDVAMLGEIDKKVEEFMAMTGLKFSDAPKVGVKSTTTAGSSSRTRSKSPAVSRIPSRTVEKKPVQPTAAASSRTVSPTKPRVPRARSKSPVEAPETQLVSGVQKLSISKPTVASKTATTPATKPKATTTTAAPRRSPPPPKK